MTTYAPPTSPDVTVREDSAQISRVPYLPGLDGMRALAVIAVMVYHANSSWLPGGFLGVEMFFVISGYLITLLIIAERERSYQVSLVDFWKRRAKRLLPALYLMMLLVTIYTALFQPEALGQLRGDVIAGLLYVSNWYQLFVGLGYTAAFDFAPLRHLWSLAVEEQFYVIWPLVMVVLLGRKGTRSVADVSRWLFVAAVAIAIVTASLYHPGVIGTPETTPDAYWFIGNHPISKLDFAYIGTFSRMSGILLGAAFAMVWRPFAVIRGPLRNKGRTFDVVGLLGLVGLGWMCWNLYLVTPAGVADPRLFRGGMFGASVLTVVVIAAVSHSGARANGVLGNPVLKWIGLRSYGLYLYHWPVYQAIRELAGNKLNVREFIVAMAITFAITEISYRFVETPVRTGSWRTMLKRANRSSRAFPRRVVTATAAVVVLVTVAAGGALATADLERNEIVDTFAENEQSTVDLVDL
ncbi:acyltransferase family protein, partial [Ilumatobacter sp.]|uniref:acyltransferase family protein n=1 Tax=Ilumatobacter sp. TaxID=1967498 RepID=UPI003C618A88